MKTDTIEITPEDRARFSADMRRNAEHMIETWPDLYEACKELLESASKGSRGGPAFDLARAALAKAGGE